MEKPEETSLQALNETRKAYHQGVSRWLRVTFRLLKACGVSQPQVGKRLAVSQSYITQWMNGKKRFPPEKAWPLLQLVQEHVNVKGLTGEKAGLLSDITHAWDRVVQQQSLYHTRIADLLRAITTLTAKVKHMGEKLTPEEVDRLRLSLLAAGEAAQEFYENMLIETAWNEVKATLTSLSK
jgi:transcriptional regulator with XRE-family HTH domain